MTATAARGDACSQVLTLHFSGPVTLQFAGLSEEQYAALALKLDSISRKADQILMDEELVKQSLDKIDAATTKAAGNLQILADTDQRISDEFDALAADLATLKANGTGVTQALVDRAAAGAVRAQAVSDSLDAMVPVLTAIAAKGVTDPVPLPVPPAPPAPPA